MLSWRAIWAPLLRTGWKKIFSLINSASSAEKLVALTLIKFSPGHDTRIEVSDGSSNSRRDHVIMDCEFGLILRPKCPVTEGPAYRLVEGRRLRHYRHAFLTSDVVLSAEFPTFSLEGCSIRSASIPWFRHRSNKTVADGGSSTSCIVPGLPSSI